MMKTGERGKAADILLVEDSTADVRLMKEALKGTQVYPQFHVVTDGIEALAFLRREGTYRNAVLPDLILLDLNLPRKHGLEVLAERNKDSLLRRIPVVVITNSTAEQDILRSYDLGANCYIVKPVDLEQFFKVIRIMEEFWLTVAQLPSQFQYFFDGRCTWSD
jgi:chemotaxis family two-component system response regulator Rcp1